MIYQNASFLFSKFEFLMKWETAIMLIKSAWFFLLCQNRPVADYDGLITPVELEGQQHEQSPIVSEPHI